MATFWCWEEYNSEESDAKPVDALDAMRAAHDYGKSRYWDDYPTEQRIAVRNAEGVVARYVVSAEETVMFRVHPAEES